MGLTYFVHFRGPRELRSFQALSGLIRRSDCLKANQCPHLTFLQTYPESKPELSSQRLIYCRGFSCLHLPPWWFTDQTHRRTLVCFNFTLDFLSLLIQDFGIHNEYAFRTQNG